MLDAAERFEQVRRALADVRPEALDKEAFGKNYSRAVPYPQLRMLAAYIMRGEGYSSPMVGKCLGIDHSTVLTTCKNMDEILGSAYPPDEWIRECYRKTVAALPQNQNESTGRKFIPEEDVRKAVRSVFKTGALTEDGYKNLCETLCI